MRTTSRVALFAAGLMTLMPSVALAGEAEAPGTGLISAGAGILSLMLAIVLLVTVVGLERVAKGSAIAESVGYVMAGVLCLATSALVRWLARFESVGYSASQWGSWADLLVVASMALLTVYFLRVRRSLMRFLRGSEEVLAKIQAAEDDYYADEED